MLDTFVHQFFLEAATLLGLLLGSFYNVCIHRYQTKESILWPPSHCPACKRQLAWWENIPLVSYLLLRGRCRQCRQHISWRYPLVEALSGLLALVLAWKFGPGPIWLTYMFFVGLLLVASFIDFDSYILPDMFTLGGAALALPAAAFILPVGWQSGLIGALAGAGIFLLLQQGYKWLRGIHGLGTGDIKLMLMLGALVGWQGLPLMILLSALSALVVSFLYLKRDASQGMRTAIPFGPFLSLGAVLYLFFGPEILAVYLRLVL